MVAFSQGTRRMQEQMAAAVIAYANPDGKILFVSSTNGSDGNNGDSPRHALATLARAVALADAGDTIICEPGGAETLTATIAVTQDHLTIVCPVVDPNAGYNLNGAGTVDLLTVSGADVRVEGLRFTRAAGAGSTTAGLLTTAAADRLAVVNCTFDCSDSTSSWINYGIELTDDILDVLVKDCTFVDCHRGVLFATGTGKDQVGCKIEGCEFWVGRATAFGIYSLAAGTGTNTGNIVKDCLFFELNGSGAAATDAWDGTDGTNGASGPLYFGAAVDQWIIADCRCSGATVSFVNRCTVISGATGTITDSVSGLDDSSSITSVGLLASTASSSAALASSKAGSDGLLISAAQSSLALADSKVVSDGLLVSGTTSAVTSTGLLTSAAQSSLALADSKVVSDGLLVSGTTSAVTSTGLLTSAAQSSLALADSKVVSDGLLVSGATSAVTSTGLLTSAAQSSLALADSKVVSGGLLASTASSLGSLVNSWDVRTVKKADLTLHNGTVEDIFTIANGPVEVLGLFIHITEAVSAHACTIGFQLDPTIGASNTPLDGATLNMISAALGDVLATVGASGSAMVKYADGTAVGLMNHPHQILMPGGIDYVPQNADPTSGIGDVYLVYRPLVATAVVTASA